MVYLRFWCLTGNNCLKNMHSDLLKRCNICLKRVHGGSYRSWSREESTELLKGTGRSFVRHLRGFFSSDWLGRSWAHLFSIYDEFMIYLFKIKTLCNDSIHHFHIDRRLFVQNATCQVRLTPICSPKMQLQQKQECYDLALRYMFEPI